MSDVMRLEFELDQRCHEVLMREADRLNLDPSEVVCRAVKAWLTDAIDSGDLDVSGMGAVAVEAVR